MRRPHHALAAIVLLGGLACTVSPARAGQVDDSVSGLLALGRAQREAGELGAAIATFERGRLLAPRDAALRSALREARSQAGAPSLPEPAMERAAGVLSLREWSDLTLSSTIAISALAVALAASRRRHVLAALLGAALVLGAVALTGYALAQRELSHAIVLDPGSVLRRAPSARAETTEPLVAGSEVELEGQRRAGFVYITSPTGQQGWLPADAVAPLAASGRREVGARVPL